MSVETQHALPVESQAEPLAEPFDEWLAEPSIPQSVEYSAEGGILKLNA